tara:strand:- start:370 stop:930 length:561 start_codon:yes stop_codon:yes gene_type:complete
MKKTKKSLLKSLVKECLIEILAEGLVGNKSATVRDQRELRGTIQETHDKMNLVTALSGESRSNGNYVDRIVGGIDESKDMKQTRRSRPNYNQNAINSKINNFTTDPVMASVLQDTAQTTLLTQNSNKGPGAQIRARGDKAAKIVESSDPTELFGEAASRWASLAHAPKSGNLSVKIAQARAGGQGY